MSISQIEIFIHPNIPDKRDPVKLTKHIITHPSIRNLTDLSELPYFSDNTQLPFDELTKLNDYSKIVKFFFNLKYFREKLNLSGLQINTKSTSIRSKPPYFMYKFINPNFISQDVVTLDITKKSIIGADKKNALSPEVTAPPAVPGNIDKYNSVNYSNIDKTTVETITKYEYNNTQIFRIFKRKYLTQEEEYETIYLSSRIVDDCIVVDSNLDLPPDIQKELKEHFFIQKLDKKYSKETRFVFNYKNIFFYGHFLRNMEKGEVVEILPKITKRYYTIVYAIEQKPPADNNEKKMLINKFLLDSILNVGNNSNMKYYFSYKQYCYADIKRTDSDNELIPLLTINYCTFMSSINNPTTDKSKLKSYKSTLEENMKKINTVFPPTGSIDDTTPQTAVSPPDSRRIMCYNVMCMLKLLFPTSLPTKYNILSSYENYIMQQTESGFSSIKDLVFSNNKYSYLSMNGKKYTVTKVIWLNDVYNNPIYKKCIDNYLFMKGKIEDEKVKVQNFIQEKYNDLMKYKSTDYKWNEDGIKHIIYNNAVYQTRQVYDHASETYLQFSYNDVNDHEGLKQSFNEPENDFFNKIEKKDTFYTEADLEKAFIGIQKPFDPTFPQRKESFDKKYILLKTMWDINLIPNDPSKSAENINKIINLYDNIKKIEDALSTLNKITQEQKKQYKKIVSFIREIYLYNTIQNNYLIDSISINLKDEEEEVLNKLKSDFKVIVDFIEGIKEILPRGGKTTTNEYLQAKIVNYSKGDSNKGDDCSFDKLLQYVSKNFTRIHPIEDDTPAYCDDIKNKDAKIYNTELMKINANEYNKPQYEIHISADLIEGEVNDENIRTAACMYKDMYLGRELEYMTKPHNIYDILEDGIFFKFDEVAMTGPKSKIVSSKQSEEKTDSSKQSAEKVEEKKEDVKKQQGGNRKKTYKLTKYSSMRRTSNFSTNSFGRSPENSFPSTSRFYEKMKPISKRVKKRVKRTLKKK
jgi:hypothetical protein